MIYMLFTYRDPSVQLDPEQRAAVPAAVAAWCEEITPVAYASRGTYSVRSRRRGPFRLERAR
jgi:hypothetical protein